MFGSARMMEQDTPPVEATGRGTSVTEELIICLADSIDIMLFLLVELATPEADRRGKAAVVMAGCCPVCPSESAC